MGRKEVTLIEWANKHGSHHLKERILGSYAWKGLAKSEYAEKILSGIALGFPIANIRDPYADLTEEEERKAYLEHSPCVDPSSRHLKAVKAVLNKFTPGDVTASAVVIEHIPEMSKKDWDAIEATRARNISRGVSGPGADAWRHWVDENQVITEGVMLAIAIPGGFPFRLYLDTGVKRGYREATSPIRKRGYVRCEVNSEAGDA